MCECEDSGLECAVQVYIGNPGTGEWICQKEYHKQIKLADEIISEILLKEKSEQLTSK